MAIKRMQMYRRNLDGTETRLNPLTEAQYVSMENGQTVQEILSDRDSDKYTPVITNSSSTFKVGQGDNVDLSSSMKEGAYDSCVLKGKTMVNCIQESSSQDVVLPYEFEEGQYVTINDTKESGALGVELKGQTLVNLVGEKREYTNAGLYGWEFMLSYKLTQGQKYLVIFNASGTITDNSKVFLMDNGFDNNTGNTLYPISFTLGYNKHIATASGNDHIVLRIRTENQTVNNLKVSDVMLIPYFEGMENWDIPYFEGMANVNMPTVKTYNGEYDFQVGKYMTNGTLSDGQHWLFFNCKPNTKYEITVKSGNYNRFGVYSYNGELGKTLTSDKTFYNYITANPNTVYSAIGVTGNKANLIGVYLSNNNHNTTLDDVVLEVLENGRKLSDKTSILQLPEEITLRSLPNGVCDTYNTRTGDYTQKIMEVTLNGEESWSAISITHESLVNDYVAFGTTPTHAGVSTQINGKNIMDTHGFSKLVVDYANNGSHVGEAITYHNNGNLYIRVLKTRLSTQDVNGWKQWLQSNPLRVQYQLRTPIVTKINLPSTLKSWNTRTYVHSEIPENTLYPILSHSNPTYPVILKPSTKYSIVANSYSNNHTNSAIKFNLGGATASTTVGNHVTAITTPSTLSNELLTMSGRGNKLNNVMVIEGDVVGDEPYFEGICDCKSPILSNVGKNLWSIPSKAFDGKNYTASSGNGYYGCKIMTLPRGTYFVKATLKNNDIVDDYMYFGITNFSTNNNGNHSFNVFYITGKGYNTNITNGFKIKITSDFQDIYLWSTSRASSSIQRVLNCLDEVHMELTNEEDIVYESYKSNTTTFNQKDDKTIVLRSLPNGVCDTLNVETGEYVQRIGEYRVTGGEEETYNTDGEAQYIYISNTSALMRMKSTSVLVCDKFPYNKSYSVYNYPKVSSTGVLIFVLPTSATGLSTKAEREAYIKNLAKTEGITVQYELATPIVSTIDVQGFPYAYTNGHVQLSSGSIEQSLTPKVEYSLSANKTGQIDSNTRQVVRQQKQLDDFEAMMLTSLVESAYDKAILQFDYEMQMMSLGGE